MMTLRACGAVVCVAMRARRQAWIAQTQGARLPGGRSQGQNGDAAARRGAAPAVRRGRRAGCGRRIRQPGPPRPAPHSVRRAAGRARRPPPRPRSGPAPPRSCRRGRSSRRPASPWRRCGRAGRRRSPSRCTAWWWQCGWATTSTPVRSGGVHVAARDPLGQELRQRAHSRAHLGDARVVDELAGVLAQRGQAARLEPDRPGSRRRRTRAASRRPGRRCAGQPSSWPVVIQVRPQQAGSGMTAARRPIDSSSSIAARPVSAANRSVKESAQIQTSTFAGQRGDHPSAAGFAEKRGQAAALVDPGSGLGDPAERSCCAASRWPAAAGSSGPSAAAGPGRSASAGAAGGAYFWRAPRTCRSPCRCRSGSRGRSPCRTGTGRGRRRPPGRRSPSVPVATSWSTRARPRVESFSSRVARYDGHITPPDAVLSAMHLPTPVQRCTASVNEPASWVSRSVVRTGRMRGGQPQVGVERRRVDQHAGVEQVVGVEDALGLLHQGDRLRRVHPRQQLRAGPPVAVLARHRAAVRRHQVGGVLDELPEPPAAAGSSSSKSMRTCTQPSPKWP